MFQYQIVTGNRSVVITANDENSGPFNCRMYVNVRDGHPGDATLVNCTRKALQGSNGAIAWARKQLMGSSAATGRALNAAARNIIPNPAGHSE